MVSSLFPQLGIIQNQLLLCIIGIWFTKPVMSSESQGFYQEFKNIINSSEVSIFLVVIMFNVRFQTSKSVEPNFFTSRESYYCFALIYVGGLYFFTDKKKMFKNIDAYLIVIITKCLLYLCYGCLICSKHKLELLRTSLKAL